MRKLDMKAHAVIANVIALALLISAGTILIVHHHKYDSLFPLPRYRRLVETVATYQLRNGFSIKVAQDGFDANFKIIHTDASTGEVRMLWRGCEGQFVRAGIGEERIQEERGSFDVQDSVFHLTDVSTVTRVVTNGDHTLYIWGDLLRHIKFSSWIVYTKKELGYRLEIKLPTGSFTQLSFDLSLVEPGYYNRVYLNHQNFDTDEKYFGFGEQLTFLNLRGKKVTSITQEGGIARGEPGLVDFLGGFIGVNGDFDSSHAPMPYYITNKRRSFFLENYEISEFDLRDNDSKCMSVKLFGKNMVGRWVFGKDPLDIIESYTEYTGRMEPLPDWVNKGAIVGMQGGTEKVLDVFEDLVKLETPMAAFWLQDWVGKRDTIAGSQLWWNWDLDEEQYPNWDYLVNRLKSQDVRVMTYINPFLVEVPDDYQGEDLYSVAKENGYLVLDPNGEEPYLIPNTDFSAAILDLTNPEARYWMKDVIQRKVIGVGASGWMADFGEALPLDATLYSGVSAKLFHNQYPEEWAKLNQEAVADAGRTGDIAFFCRSGYTKSPGLATLFWEGDQMVLWDENDGLKSAITGLLSSGLSGFSLNHNDIGGYTSISVPLIIDISRTKELLFRWMEMNAFTAAFRTHEGIQPEVNFQFYSTSESLKTFSRFSKVFAALADYRAVLMGEAAQKGYPVARHPWLHYPDDDEACELKYQWMLGSEFMVAPVTEEGQDQVYVYLPQGSWTHIWSRDVFEGSAWHLVDAPMGEPAVFFKTGSAAGEQFLSNLFVLLSK